MFKCPTAQKTTSSPCLKGLDSRMKYFVVHSLPEKKLRQHFFPGFCSPNDNDANDVVQLAALPFLPQPQPPAASPPAEHHRLHPLQPKLPRAVPKLSQVFKSVRNKITTKRKLSRERQMWRKMHFHIIIKSRNVSRPALCD